MAIWHSSPHGSKYVQVFIAMIVKQISEDCKPLELHGSAHPTIEDARRKLKDLIKDAYGDSDVGINLLEVVSTLKSDDETITDDDCCLSFAIRSSKIKLK